MADSLLQDDQSERAAIIAKWKDKPREELESAKAESDIYIKTLTARFDDLKKDYLEIKDQQQASAQLKELIEQFKSRPPNDDTVRTQQDIVNQPAIKSEDIERLVREQLTKHQTSLKQQQNLDTVQARLKEHFGNDYQSVYKQRLDNLGLSPEYADDLAKNYPTVFMKTFELESRPQNVSNSLPKSQQRMSSYTPSTIKKDWNYYQELKKTNPKLYLDPKIANEMHDQAIALGEDFGLPLY